MPRHVAFLRGVAPAFVKMDELKRCFESAGFTGVRVVLSSGNVAFDARSAAERTLERQAEAAMTKLLGRSFYPIVRSADALRELIAADPFGAWSLPAQAKRVVTFAREAPDCAPALPIEQDGARILAIRGRDVLSAYLPSPRGPVFMKLIERTFGAAVTTRTWNTVRKCASA